MILTRTANEGAPPFELLHSAEEHDAWFRAKVEEAIEDPRPTMPHSRMKAHFEQRRNAGSRKARASFMRLEWSLMAFDDRIAIFDYIAADNPGAAIAIDERIEEQIETSFTPRSWVA